MPENKIPGLFTVYYMNQQKVFETRMLLDNKLKTTSSKENQNGTTKRASLNAEAELNPPFLTKLRAKLEGSVRHEKQEKIVDTLEYVNTNSRMLADIMEHCKAPESGTTLAEGDLAYIGDVSLELINEEEIRGIMAIMSFVPTPSMLATRTGSLYFERSSWKRPPKPPTGASISGRRASANFFLTWSSSDVARSISTPAALYKSLFTFSLI